MPKLLFLVSPGRRTSVPIRAPQDWVGAVCARCERRVDDDPAVFLEAGEVRCVRCLGSRVTAAQCTWCGREGARLQDVLRRYCQPCWAIYVAYVGDEVEDPASPYNQLLQQVSDIIEEEQRAEPDPEAPPPTD